MRYSIQFDPATCYYSISAATGRSPLAKKVFDWYGEGEEEMMIFFIHRNCWVMLMLMVLLVI